MRRLSVLYDGLIEALAWFAALCLFAVLAMVAYDVAVRTLGFRPPGFTSAVSEYLLLYFTMAAGPFLVRNKGHVFIESGRAFMPPGMRRAAEQATYLLCILICLVLAWFALELTRETVAHGEVEIRSVAVPRWVLFVVLPPSFLLMAVEFCRFLIGRDSMYVLGDDERDSL